MAGKERHNKQHRQRLTETAPIQAAQLLPAPGGEQHLDQENSRHADKHQLPVARHLGLIGIDHQLPHHRIQVQVEAVKNGTVDQDQRQASRGDNGRKEAQQPLGHHHKGQREDDQQIGGKDDKAEVTHPTGERINAPGQRGWPVGDKQVTAAKNKGKDDIKEGEPMPPANHLGDFFSVALPIGYHNRVRIIKLMGFIIAHGSL